MCRRVHRWGQSSNFLLPQILSVIYLATIAELFKKYKHHTNTFSLFGVELDRTNSNKAATARIRTRTSIPGLTLPHIFLGRMGAAKIPTANVSGLVQSWIVERPDWPGCGGGRGHTYRWQATSCTSTDMISKKPKLHIRIRTWSSLHSLKLKPFLSCILT